MAKDGALGAEARERAAQNKRKFQFNRTPCRDRRASSCQPAAHIPFAAKENYLDKLLTGIYAASLLGGERRSSRKGWQVSQFGPSATRAEEASGSGYEILRTEKRGI